MRSRVNFDACAVCNGDDFDFENFRLHCNQCENFVHSQCVGEDQKSMRTSLYSEL